MIVARLRRVCAGISPVHILAVIMIWGAFIRVAAYPAEKDILQYNYNYAREGAAIALSKGWGYVIYPVPDHRSTSNKVVDPEDYMRGIEDPDPHTLPSLFFNPGPPTVMAALYKVFGYHFASYQIFQLTLTWLLIPLVYLTGTWLFGSRVGLVAAAINASAMFEVKHSFFIAREVYPVTALVTTMAAAAWLMTAGQRAHPRRAILVAALAGFSLGLMLLFRTTPAPVGVGFAVAMVLAFPLRRAALLTLVYCGAVVATLTPWMVRNYQLTDQVFIGKESQFFGVWGGIGNSPNYFAITPTDTVTFASIRTYGQLSGNWAPAGGYYGEGAIEYERMAKDLYSQYVSDYPQSAYDMISKNFMENAVNFTGTQGYAFDSVVMPQFQFRIFNKLSSLYQRWLGVLPIIALCGLVIAFFRGIYVVPLFVMAAMCILIISLGSSGVVRYTYHVLPIYYICVGVLVSEAVGLAKYCVCRLWGLVFARPSGEYPS